ncbi:MAG: Tol-Pal system beta propeller repeat protein TolB [Nitrospirota bacterium]|nr:Tol-Pal system beta propeller repeat protein TolB [Nitrospirota bacterium]
MTRFRFMTFIFLLLSGVGTVWMFESFGAEIFLEAKRSDFQKIPIWVLGFGDGDPEANSGSRIGNKISGILRADLKRSQVFAVEDSEHRPLRFNQGQCRSVETLSQAKKSGATVVSWGRIGRKGPDLVMEACAYDRASEAEAVGKRYEGGPITMRLLRLMVHRWADELVSRYTGDPGIARTKIVFVSEVHGGRNLYVMDYDGYGPKPLTADRRLNLMPAWSPDKRSLIYTAYRQHNQEIVQLHLASGETKTLVPPKSLNITPAFSPDGKLLAYASAKDGNSDIYTLDLLTQERVQLTFDASADLSPSWSPNGREIVFTSDRGGRPQVYIMSADGSNVRRLTFEGNYNAAPAWSPQGDWIAYVCQIPALGFKLCRISPDGQQQFQITSGPRSEMDDSPSWSPNGRHLVFSSTRKGRSHIYMINVDGMEPAEQLTSGGTHHSSPAWSPL